MSEHLKLYCLLIEPIAEPDKILLGVTLNPGISLVNTNGRAHSTNTVVHQIWLMTNNTQQTLSNVGYSIHLCSFIPPYEVFPLSHVSSRSHEFPWSHSSYICVPHEIVHKCIQVDFWSCSIHIFGNNLYFVMEMESSECIQQFLS